LWHKKVRSGKKIELEFFGNFILQLQEHFNTKIFISIHLMTNFRILKPFQPAISFASILLVLMAFSGTSSCVKNTPFKDPFSVPSSYHFESTDSSAKAKVIMMKAMENYLSTANSGVLDTLLIDSLWQNKNNSFTPTMAPDFLYSAAILNNMKTIGLMGSTNSVNELMIFADSLYIASKSYSINATNGTAGFLQSGASKYLVSRSGRAYKEIWANAMIGGLAMSNVSSLFMGANGIDPLNLAYDFMGLPRGYDPGTNYDTPPVKADRPLGIASLFAITDTGKQMAAKIYEEFRRAGAALKAGNSDIAGGPMVLIRDYTDKAIAAALISYLDNVKKSSDKGIQLHNLSMAYGLVWAMQFRLVQGALTNQDYNALRVVMDTNFYTLIQESGFTKINQVRNAFANAYGL